MANEPAKQFAADLLDAFGCSVKFIEENEKSECADIFAHDASSEYVVEVKEKIDDPVRVRMDEKLMQGGGFAEHEDSRDYHNRFAGIFRKAESQLVQTTVSSSQLRLVWFHVTGTDADLYWSRAFATFYGAVHVLPRLAQDSKYCFYFDYSVAYTCRNIDAMILSDRKGVQLCLNELSERANGLRRSSLFQQFASSNAAIDPSEFESDRRIIALRSEISRRNENDVLRALENQKNEKFTVMRLKRYSAASMVFPANQKAT